MIKVRRYRIGEEEILRELCRNTTLLVNLKEYGSELVQKWAKRLEGNSTWNSHVRNRNPFVAEVDGEIVGFSEFTEKGRIGAFYSHHLWQQKKRR